MSKSRPSGKIPDAREMASCPSASNSWSSTTSLKPQAQNLSACKRKLRLSSRNRSWSWRCCGVRKVPLVQRTGCSCFMGTVYQDSDKNKGLEHDRKPLSRISREQPIHVDLWNSQQA